MKKLQQGIRFLFCISILTGLLAACEKPDNLPQLEIRILDINEQPVAGAFSALFETYEDWLARKDPVQVWRRSDSGGKILFTDLEEKIYFIYVRNSEADNSLDEISLAEPLKINYKTEVTIHIR
ncbi:MAG TPA: hypothetical protein DC042_11025 [Bacteroidales bacterium]|nr:hypothetical protein [Bacteroidales bacterium]